jgi:Flp pilus assembly pilin Flp
MAVARYEGRMPEAHPNRRRLRSRRAERGASLVEYMMLVGLVALVATGGFRIVGTSVRDKISCQAATLFGSGAECSSAETATTSAAVSDAGGGTAQPDNPDLPSGSGASYTPIEGDVYVQGEGEKSAADPSDISQGSLNDCYVLSPLAAIAHVDPGFIEDMVRDNGDGTYSVRLREPDPQPWWQFWEPDTRDVWVTVSGDFPTVDGNPVYAKTGDGSGDHRELWPLIIEKAYAQHMGGYTAFENGGDPSETLADITGKEVTRLTNADSSFDDLYALYEDGNAIVTNTKRGNEVSDNPLFQPDSPAGEPLVAWHIYYVVGMDEANQTVTLRNPYGWDRGTVTVTWEQYQESFRITGAVDP